MIPDPLFVLASPLDAVGRAVQYVLDLGPPIMMPVMLALFGLLLRQGLTKSIRAGLIIGVGFIGIHLVVKLLVETVGPQAMAFSRALGLQLTVLDVGWPVGAAASFASPIALVLIPAIFALNLLMVFTRTTSTMDVDLWNYWHFIYTGALVETLTGSRGLGVLGACITAALILKLADWTAPAVERHFGLPGVSLPHTETVNWAPLMYVLERIERRIPGFNRIDLNPEKIRQRFGLLGEPITMGALLGLLIGALGSWPTLRSSCDSATGCAWGVYIKNTLYLSITMAAVLVILPKMVALLMEGLMPIAEGARELFQRRFPDRQIYIGLDAAVVIAHPAGMAVALLLVPIALLLAMVLPGNRMLPFADLAVLAFYIIWAVACSRGNIFRGLINGVLVMVGILYIGSDLAGLTTQIAKNVSFIPDVAGANAYVEWSGVALGSHVLPWILLRLFDVRSTKFFWALGAAVLYALCWLWVRNDIRRQFAEASVAKEGA
jgi:PTS system galactitol-specific IIC component